MLLITPTETLIVLGITKTSYNNCITRNTCIAEPREGRGKDARKLSAMGWRERNRVSCVTSEGGFQQRL